MFSDYAVRSTYKRRMVDALTRLEAVRASIPDTWWWVDEGVPAQITWDTIGACLERCRRDDFWNIP